MFYALSQILGDKSCLIFLYVWHVIDSITLKSPVAYFRNIFIRSIRSPEKHWATSCLSTVSDFACPYQATHVHTFSTVMFWQLSPKFNIHSSLSCVKGGGHQANKSRVSSQLKTFNSLQQSSQWKRDWLHPACSQLNGATLNSKLPFVVELTELKTHTDWCSSDFLTQLYMDICWVRENRKHHLTI